MEALLYALKEARRLYGKVRKVTLITKGGNISLVIHY